MGSTESLYFFEEELLLSKKEQLLPYNLHSPEKLDLIHRIHSLNGKISLNQWNQIKQILSFPKETPNTDLFFSSFNQPNGYSLKHLALLSLLLSYGNYTNKAKILFDIIDTEHSNVITKEEIKILADELIDISVNRISLLVPQNSKMTQYVNILNRNKNRAKDVIVKSLCKKNAIGIDSQAFVDRFYKKKAFCF